MISGGANKTAGSRLPCNATRLPARCRAEARSTVQSRPSASAPLAASGADALGLDWTVDLASARQRAGKRVALQGNLDPAVLLAPPDIIRAEVRAALDAYGP